MITQAQHSTLSLSDAVQIALQKNFQISVAKRSSEIAENNANPGNAGLLPQITANAAFNRSVEQFEASGSIFDVDTSGVQADQLSASVNFNYVLFDGFGNVYRFRSLQNLKEQSGVQERLQIESTLLQVIQQYLQVAALDKAVEITEGAIDRSLTRLQRARNRYDLGTATRLEVLNARVDLNTDSVNYFQARTNLENAKRSLNINLGLDPENPIAVLDEIRLDNSLSSAELLSAAEVQNASLVLSKLNLDNARLGLKSQRSSRFPVISLQGNYIYNNIDGGAGIFNQTTTSGFNGGITISLNLFNGTQQEIRIQNAQISLKSNQDEYEFAKLALRRDVLNAYESYRTNHLLLEKEALNLETAEMNYERAAEQYDLGQISSADIREAQLNVSRVEERLVNLRIQAKLSEVELYQLAGMLIEGGLD
jgi:outer membrane protein TolC